MACRDSSVMPQGKPPPKEKITDPRHYHRLYQKELRATARKIVQWAKERSSLLRKEDMGCVQQVMAVEIALAAAGSQMERVKMLSDTLVRLIDMEKEYKEVQQVDYEKRFGVPPILDDS